ncbi:Fur-regulated basic protein FbpA [Metabacillus idriensis]|nr:Fur-regulated basic protein FbpA [Metabacillus idriensis]
MNTEQKKDELKNELIKLNYFKTPDGKQLYELDLSELEEIYENEKGK